MKRCLACSVSFDGTGWRCPACGFTAPSSDGIVLHAPELADGDGTDANYPFESLAKAEASHFWFRSRSVLIANAVAKYFPGAGSFMEVGAGGGGVLAAIQRSRPKMRLVGGELLVRGLREAGRRLHGVELHQMDARRIPFVSEFDVAGAFDVIEHVDDDAAVLEQMRAALVPGGGVVLTVPQHPWLWSAFDELSGHRRRYTRRELVARMIAAGFGLVRVTSFASLVLPLIAASRFRRRTTDLAQELAIPGMVNRALLAVTALERAAIGAGASFPAGGSLLAVGVRRA